MKPTISLSEMLMASLIWHGRQLQRVFSGGLSSWLVLPAAVFIWGGFLSGNLGEGLGLCIAILSVFAASVVLRSLSPALKAQELRRKAAVARVDMLCRRQELVESLSPALRVRYKALLAKVSRTSDLFRDEDDIVKPGEYLAWTYLKLLLALDHLSELTKAEVGEELIRQRDDLVASLEDPELSQQACATRLDTLNLIDQRFLSARQSKMRMEETESELDRIEQKLALLHERAAQSASSGQGLQVDLYSEAATLTFSPQGFGENVAELDRLYANSGVY